MDKTHKIPNISKDVCCAEQMIAYNLAFRAHISFQHIFDKCETEIQKSELVTEIMDTEMRNYRVSYDYKPGKYNEDTIFCCLNQGLKRYLEKPFIANDYESVGKCFEFVY